MRLLTFVAAVMALFFFARQGQSQPVMYGAFAAFLVAATLWVRGLDANWIERRPDYRSPSLLGLALGVPAAATIFIWMVLERSWSTFVLGALITVYIAAGLIIRWLRWQVMAGGSAEAQDSRGGRLTSWFLSRVRRWQVLAGLLGVAYLALWALGRAPLPLAGWTLLLAVALVPAVVHVLSERRVAALSSADADKSRRRWVVYGAAASVTGLAIGAASLGHTRYLFIFVVVVALFTWAMAVGSLADIAVLLAVLALMGVTPASQTVEPTILSATAKEPKPSGQPEAVVVALGDSYSSGEGASHYLDDTNVAGGNQCRRAATAWPVLVAQSLGVHRLVFRACSGARARNVVGSAAVDEQYPGEGIQVEQALAEVRAADPDLDPALVVLSIGGNDAGFRQIGSSCLSMDSCDDKELTKYFDDNLPAVDAALRATYGAIEKAFPRSPIAVMPYPDAFAEDRGCVRAPVEEGDIRFVRDFTDRLDRIIEDAAHDMGIYYVADMRTALTTSQLALCDESGTPGLNFLDLRGVGGTARERFNPGNWIHNSLHPNERGHAALAAAFTGWLSQQTREGADGMQLTGLAALMPPAMKRGVDGVDDPPPDLPAPTMTSTTLCFEKHGGDCGPRADAWALSRLGPGTVLPLLLGALVAGGTWAFAVGVSASRFRRRWPDPAG